MPSVKEPSFFAGDTNWAKGPDWYRAIFVDIPESATTGEASVIYSDPNYAATAATRIAEMLPRIQLVCLLRDPVERLRSHYRHEVQRGRESRPLLDALADPTTPYIRRSQYHSALRPYLDRFHSEQLLIVSMMETVTPPFSGWYRVLSHLGVNAVAPDGEAVNVTSEKLRFSGLALRLWDLGILNRTAQVSPQWLRHVGRRALLRDTAQYRNLLASAELPIPRDVIDHLEREVSLLEFALGRSMGFQQN